MVFGKRGDVHWFVSDVVFNDHGLLSLLGLTDADAVAADVEAALGSLSKGELLSTIAHLASVVDGGVEQVVAASKTAMSPRRTTSCTRCLVLLTPPSSFRIFLRHLIYPLPIPSFTSSTFPLFFVFFSRDNFLM
jgi:hypothetical protein